MLHHQSSSEPPNRPPTPPAPEEHPQDRRIILIPPHLLAELLAQLSSRPRGNPEFENPIPPEIPSEAELFEVAKFRFQETIKELKNHPSIVQHFPQLLTFADSVRSRTYGMTPSPAPDEKLELQRKLRSIPSTHLVHCYSSLLKSIRDQTSYFQKFEELGIFHDLASGFRGRPLGVKLKFLGDKQAEVHGLDQGVTAIYDSAANTAYIEGTPPEIPDLWAELATTGALPDQIEHIHHELIHSLQRGTGFSPPRRRLTALAASIVAGLAAIPLHAGIAAQLTLQLTTYFALDSVLRKLFSDRDQNHSPMSRALRELQAYTATEESPSQGRPRRNPLEHINHIALQIGTEVGLFSPPDRSMPLPLMSPSRTFAAAAAVVGSGATLVALRMLGVTHHRLGEIVRSAEFDPRTASFPDLEAELKLVRAKLGLHDDGTYTKLIDALNFKAQVEWREARATACRLAQEALSQLDLP